jgi:hypothetical protein
VREEDGLHRVLDSLGMRTRRMNPQKSVPSYHEQFDQTLDEQTLIGFNNGIFDLERNQFREGSPEDLKMSMCTRYRLIRDGVTAALYLRIDDFFCKVFPTATCATMP